MNSLQRKYNVYSNLSPQRNRIRHKKITYVKRDSIAKDIRSSREELRLRKIRKRLKLLKSLSLFTFCALFVALSAFALSGYTKIAQKNMELSAITKRINSLEASKDHVAMSLEPYKSSERIEKIARVSLGMDYPTDSQYMYMDLNTAIKEKGPAKSTVTAETIKSYNDKTKTASHEQSR